MNGTYQLLVCADIYIPCKHLTKVTDVKNEVQINFHTEHAPLIYTNFLKTHNVDGQAKFTIMNENLLVRTSRQIPVLL